VSWYRPRNIATTALDISTRKLSYQATFLEATVKQRHTVSSALRVGQFVAYSASGACWNRQLFPVHIASSANHHIEIVFGRGNGKDSCLAGGIDRQIASFDVISHWKAICVPILLHVTFLLISMTKLWDTLLCQCMLEGRTHHANVVESTSGHKTTIKLDIFLPVTVKLDRKNWITDQIYKHNVGEWWHSSHRLSSQCSVRICLNEDSHAASIHVSNCITLRTDLVHMVEILGIV